MTTGLQYFGNPSKDEAHWMLSLINKGHECTRMIVSTRLELAAGIDIP